MNKPTVNKIREELAELYKIRDEKRKNLTDLSSKISAPFQMMAYITKPILKNISWLPIAVSAVQVAVGIIRKRKK